MAIRVLRPSTFGLAAALASGSVAAAPTPSLEQMWQQIRNQQQEIEQLKSRNQQLEQKVEATGEAVDQARRNRPEDDASDGAAVSSVAAAHEETRSHAPFHHGQSGETTIGGYGEMHYNNLTGEGGASDKDEIDFHRFILFLNHEFDARTRFASELEVEHAFVEDENDGSGDTAPGEVALEYAYIERDFTETLQGRAGMLLMPIGIINETHEPPTFYGTERNAIETNIIPSTWREGGVSITGRPAPGWQYDIALHSGLGTSSGSNYAVRSGRKGVGEAPASDPAITARVKWTAVPGLELGAAVQHQTDVTQGTDPTAGSANLVETHAIWTSGAFGLRALYARWDLDGAGPASVGADVQEGWYVEPSYKLTSTIGTFARYSEWDNRAGSNTARSEKSQWEVGVNYWPHPDVVLKVDYQQQDNEDGREQNGVNLGVGYMF